MGMLIRCGWQGIRLCLVLLLVCLPVGAGPVPVRAAGTTVSIFYPATKAAYDTWNASTSMARPPRTTVFPSGTKLVTVYFEYRGSKANSTAFTIVVHDRSEATFTTHGPYTLTLGSGVHMSKVEAPAGKVYPDGTYRADLLVDGHVVISSSFRVGTPGHSLVSLATFYTATKAAYDAWNATTSTARPPKSGTFRSGTSIVAFYFEYGGAVPKVTHYQLVIRDQGGHPLVTYGPYAFSYTSALAMRYVRAPDGTDYPNGTYRADLLLDGRVAASTRFSVGSQGASITTFYPITKAAYDAWGTNNTPAQPSKTTLFAAGTTVVALFFHYQGATPHVTTYQVIIRDQKGAAYFTGKVHPLIAAADDHLSSMNNGAAYPTGDYRVDLLINGAVAVSTFFTVGKQATVQPCTSSDVVATCVEPSILRLHANLPNTMQAEGTGFVIRSDSTGTYLLTNKHVVDGATARTLVAISMDGHTEYPAVDLSVNNADAGSAGDLAVVKLAPTSLRPLTWGDSDHLHLLQQVISIGYGDAFNLPGPPTATEGIISALHRDLGDGYGPIWIQHQSFINHGNSGGPLLDMRFHVVGINTLSQKQTQGIFFAIPAAAARLVAQKLMDQLR